MGTLHDGLYESSHESNSMKGSIRQIELMKNFKMLQEDSLTTTQPPP